MGRIGSAFPKAVGACSSRTTGGASAAAPRGGEPAGMPNWAVSPAATRSSMRIASGALGRSAAFFSIRACRTGASSPALRGSGSGSVTTAASVVSGESRRNGDWPSTAAYRVAPRPHRSDSGPGREPCTRSGAR